MATNRLKNRYLQTFGITVIVLALVRCVFPGVAGHDTAVSNMIADIEVDSLLPDTLNEKQKPDVQPQKPVKSPEQPVPEKVSAQSAPVKAFGQSTPIKPSDYKTPASVKTSLTHYVADGEKFHRIVSVPSYDKSFPDSNHVQILAAQHWGVPPVKNRQDAEVRKNELVYMGNSIYYDVAPLSASIPYLVPRAAVLLEDIGRNFFDSLQVKGMPLHRIIVSSVLRTEEDVARLRLSNKNATEQSCHLYGTTFDINYNFYSPVTSAGQREREAVSDIRLKQILSEVLNDLRQQNRCYIKYEYKQPCFHITVR